MALISDILLLAATIGAMIYCLVLSRRLRRFNTLETGMGGAIAVLSAQVDDMTRAVEAARLVAVRSETRLEELTRRADTLARRLELLVASLHDLPEAVDAEQGNGTVASENGAGDRRLRFVRRRAVTSAREEVA